ncbi:DUF29 domain-containing protein [Aphanothece sacrum]|uniref:DUF29 domain-containing protein n=1 Tax=Aphanothece sacrum FPU1 TaxID=1920663 RepID=A0A401IE59_APHSA|nr:DUF29 domain-containing protein [Aphanothece sacrum]GBF79531.1 hypothetical protein AsFPU1_0927 [Aphanothece sacrum FPU1]GBF83928.1 hypothetical protein AsFPU3_0972 [Aphanothece sacrum FPU3]
MTTYIDIRTLYESDYLQWLEETVNLLKSRQLNKLDYDNLIEELEALGRTEKRAITSLLEQIIRHLLLDQYWTVEHEFNANHWEAEIISFRNQLNKCLTTNLYKYLQNNLESIYDDAKDYIKAKTKLNNLPDICPYTLNQLLDKTWLP